MNIVLFGAPGAGKGTQSTMLVEKLGFVQISTGDIFRRAIKNKTDLGLKAKEFMDQGKLVPDELTIQLVDEVLVGLKGQSFILDGFPRTMPQALALEDILKKRDLVINKAIFLEVPKDQLVARLSGRRVCKGCGAVYHIDSKPSKSEGVCDLCSSEVVQRSDDQAEVIITRLKTYEENTSPLREYFRGKGKYFELDGALNADQVFKNLKQILSS